MARVGMIPISMGFRPLKKPPMPCCSKISRAMAIGLRVERPRRDDCSCVLTTSSGRVVVAEIVPAKPPLKKLIACICFCVRRVRRAGLGRVSGPSLPPPSPKLANVFCPLRSSPPALATSSHTKHQTQTRKNDINSHRMKAFTLDTQKSLRKNIRILLG